jgi:two-component system nitrogen regulation response regulator GlnG
MANILLIDDYAVYANSLREHLEAEGHEVVWKELAEDGLELLASGKPFDLVLLDNFMPRMTGLDFLTALENHNVNLPVILMTCQHNDHTVIEALKRGAFDYLLKPDDFTTDVKSVGELHKALAEALAVATPPPPVTLVPADADCGHGSVIAGKSQAILDVLKQIGRYAVMKETVLILGETGTGKNLVARAIHTHSSRQEKRFVQVDCPGLDENLLASELFGHEKYAFTGADKLRKGRFEHADGGTLFLDEVGDMPPALQAKLLLVLENREITRMGSNDPIPVDVRVVAATSRDLRAMVKEGTFRHDLLQRLEGLKIRLPPLRERPEDVELLARRFLNVLSGGGAEWTLHPDAMARLRGHPWPGNIRQLQRVLCRAVGSRRGKQILPRDLDFGELDDIPEPPPTQAAPAPPAPTTDGDPADLSRLIEWAWNSYPEKLWPHLQKHLERELLRYALARIPRNKRKLADRLGIAHNTLYARLEEFGLEAPSPDD